MWSAALLLAACGGTIPPAGAPAGAADTLPLLWTDIRLDEFGVGSPEQIRRGRLTVALHADGAELRVASLRTRVPPVRPIRATSAPLPLDGSGCFSLDVGRRPAGNTLRGRFGTFALGESSASVDLDPDQEGAPGVTVSCDRADGACGLWLHLFETGAERRTYVDATDLETLTLWVRGELGRERVLVKAADALWERRGDALPLGDLGEFTEAGAIQREWQRAVIPLEALPPRLERDSLASIVFEALDPGRSTVRMAGVQLCASGGDPADRPSADLGGQPEASDTVHRALWVWRTGEILRSDEERTRFLAFVEDGGFDKVFMYLPPAEGSRVERGFVPFDGRELSVLIADLTARGAETYALDGDPAYVLPGNREGILRTVGRIGSYNRNAPPEARFVGVRYNVEPYLLPGFQGPRQQEFLDGYAALVTDLARRAQGEGLRVGLDIPLWWDSRDEDTGELLEATVDGRRASLLDHILAVVDDISVMGYRTSAYGADGSIVQVLGELNSAAALGAEVFVGLESGPLPDELMVIFEGAPTVGEPPEEGPLVALSAAAAGTVRAWLVPPGRLGDLPLRAESADEEAAPRYFWSTTSQNLLRADRLTFDAWGQERLEEEADRLVRELRGHPAFAGVAYHYYGSLVDLTRR